MNKAVSELIRNASGTKNTVIVLVGWAGAKDNHLRKYVQLYQQRGYDTLQFTANIAKTAGGGLVKDSREVSALADNIKEVLKDKKVAIHCFSMNGVYTVASLHLQYPELEVFKNTEGILFDSAPVSLGFESINSYMEVLDHSNVDKIAKFNWSDHIWWKFYKFGKALQMAKYQALIVALSALGMDTTQYNSYELLKTHPDLPQILSFIYSDADHICPAKYIEAFAKYQRNMRKDVDELRLKDSEHVQHFRKYPAEYERVIDRFLDKVNGKAKL